MTGLEEMLASLDGVTDPEPVQVRWLLTISREWVWWTLLRMRFTVLAAAYPRSVMVHGNAPQGDQQAARIWHEEFGGQVDPWPADWGTCTDECRHRPRFNRAGQPYCPVAGFRRNTAMVQQGRCRYAEAFIHNHSRGATDCAKKAKAAGLIVTIHRNPWGPR